MSRALGQVALYMVSSNLPDRAPDLYVYTPCLVGMARVFSNSCLFR